MSRIVLGVSGGIAAYKACELLRRLQGAGHEITVVPTAAALEFVGASTWGALSGRPVHTSVFDDAHLVPHVKLGQEVDLVFVAPATADLLARAASGRADDLLTNVLLTAHCPIVFAPAMHSEMWLHAATQANVDTLRSRGALVVRPDTGRLAGPDAGPGRLPDPAELLAVAVAVLADPSIAVRAAGQDMAGLKVVVSAGGTREHLDPVRFIGNSSSGLMGWALARAAVLRGADVRLVAANVGLHAPPGTEVEAVSSTADLASGHGGGGQGRRHRGHGGGTSRLHTGPHQSDQDQKIGRRRSRAEVGADHRRACRSGGGSNRRSPDLGWLRSGDAECRGDTA